MEEAVVAVANVSQELNNTEQRLQVLFRLLNDPSTLPALPPLHRAATFLSLSKTLNALFSLYLRCKGLTPEGLTSSEVERVRVYESKVGHFVDDMEAPKHRTTSLNVEAANRFIEHAIPDLTEEQKKDLQRIKMQCLESKHGHRKARNLLNLPLKPTRMLSSITEAATAFLEEARREMLLEDSTADR